MNDLRNLNNEPFIIHNRIYVLGNPVVTTQTLEQLIHTLDQLGDSQPIVIINPEAQTIPNFDKALSNLIQNNRDRQNLNVTSDDKYRFKDFTDEELENQVKKVISHNPVISYQGMLEVYRGLRLRAQSLYYLESLSKERDALWQQHCINPSSTEGCERYNELQNQLIPEAQSYYDFVCNKLQELEASIRVDEPPVEKQAANTATQQINNSIVTQQEDSSLLAAVADVAANKEIIESTSSEKRIKIWQNWLSEDYLIMPLTSAKQIAQSPAYEAIRTQQLDCIVGGISYQAVELEYLIALGISLFPDGLPIVYTNLGKFKRVGNSSQPVNNLAYWYPEPRRL